MREILFRGKRVSNGEWVNGNLFIPDLPDTPTQICIGTNVVRISYDIDPQTIGQYTGLTDKNGTKIFEGDILSDGINVVSVIWNEYSAEFQLLEQDGYSGDFIEFENILIGGYKRLEVIGNIHDNPELLGDE